MALFTDKAIILDPAANSINTVFGQRLDADHTDSAQDRPHAVSIMRLMHRNAEGALPDLSGYKWCICLAVEAFTAEILGFGFYEVSRSRTKETDRPANVNPDASATLANN